MSCWPYRHDRDLTGFIDGTENPPLSSASDVAVVPDDAAGGGGSVLLQRWTHDVAAWEAVPIVEQERVMSRTKADSVELDGRPRDSHVARTDQDEVGKVFRRNMPYGMRRPARPSATRSPVTAATREEPSRSTAATSWPSTGPPPCPGSSPPPRWTGWWPHPADQLRADLRQDPDMRLDDLTARPAYGR